MRNPKTSKNAHKLSKFKWRVSNEQERGSYLNFFVMKKRSKVNNRFYSKDTPFTSVSIEEIEKLLADHD